MKKIINSLSEAVIVFGTAGLLLIGWERALEHTPILKLAVFVILFISVLRRNIRKNKK